MRRPKRFFNTLLMFILGTLVVFQYMDRKRLEQEVFDLKVVLNRGIPTQVPDKPNALTFTQPLKRTTVDVSDIQVKDLSGEWLLTMPMGANLKIKLVQKSDTILAFEAIGNFKGQYRIDNGMLIATQINNADFTDFQWQIESPNRMRLVHSVVRIQVGNNYTGAILTR